MAATIKVIPCAMPRRALDACLAVARDGPPMLRVAPLWARKVGLVQTALPGTKASILAKGRKVMDQRLASLDCPPAEERRWAPDEAAAAAAGTELRGAGCGCPLARGASAPLRLAAGMRPGRG